MFGDLVEFGKRGVAGLLVAAHREDPGAVWLFDHYHVVAAGTHVHDVTTSSLGTTVCPSRLPVSRTERRGLASSICTRIQTKAATRTTVQIENVATSQLSQ
mgnify:CR=1 FL=1